MKIPGLGDVTKDDRFGWYYSAPLQLSILGGKECCVVIEGYDEDENKDDYHTAINQFLSAPHSTLKEAEKYIFAYYQEMNSNLEPSDEEFVSIESPSNIWEHIQLGDEPMVCRRGYRDKGIYVSLECNCDWEPEHGLQIVFKDGNKVCKVGPYDGHLTNSDAYADDSLENVIYR